MAWWIGLVSAINAIKGPLPAQDRVTVRPADSAGLMTLVGEIVDYDDRTLTLRMRSGAPLQTLESRDVAAVESYRTPGHQAGIVAFEEGRIDDAVREFHKGLETERRRWVRRELLAWLVRCHQRRGELELAVVRFVEIVIDDPRTRHWDIAPLAWGAETISPDLRAHARRWTLHKSEAVRLFAASLLLNDPAVGAQQDLEQLARGGDHYIGNLARAQLWRLRLQSGGPDALELERWRRDVERMPESIRGGPWFLVGQAWLQRSGLDEGAAALLRVFIAHAGNEPLAARAGLDAALALTRLNRDDEAHAVYLEIVERFGWTSFAAEARAQAGSERGG